MALMLTILPVPYARAYATTREPRPGVRETDAMLRAAPEPVGWLEREWL
jgi:hypothetical protein